MEDGEKEAGRFFSLPGFPVGVNWGKEQQKVGSEEVGSEKEAVRRGVDTYVRDDPPLL